MPQLCWGSEMDFGVVIPTILSQEAWFWGMSIQMHDSQNPLGIGEFNRCSMVTLNQPQILRQTYIASKPIEKNESAKPRPSDEPFQKCAEAYHPGKARNWTTSTLKSIDS